MPLSSDIADIEARLCELTQNATYPQRKGVFPDPWSQTQLPMLILASRDISQFMPPQAPFLTHSTQPSFWQSWNGSYPLLLFAKQLV